MHYRKKPVIIEAHNWHFNGDHPLDAGDRTDFNPDKHEGALVRRFRRPDIDGFDLCRECGLAMCEHGWIDTLEGGHIVCPHDWIITGVRGEHYPVKHAIFMETYEPVEAP